MKNSDLHLNKPIWLVFLLLLFVSASVPAAKFRITLTYQSSISSDQNGPLDLKAELNFDNAVYNAPIIVVMHGYSPSSGNFDNVRLPAQRLRDEGFFAISVAMRARDGSDGVRDSGGVEIFDIYDAIQAVIQKYPGFVDPDNVSITGYSGGGGNTMSALTKFPDTFRVGAGFFGMSDYGYDPANGWYFDGAGTNHQAQMRTDIGNPTTGNPLVQDRYMARASNLASKNNPYSEIHLFVNHNETTCPPINSTSYRDNAIAAETVAGEFGNITVHIGGYGECEDFDSDGVNDPEELQNWPHNMPTENQQYAAQAWFLDRLLAGQIPQPVMNRQDSLFVAGYVKTKPFFLWLGDGQNAAAQLQYSLSTAQKTFEMDMLSSDTGVTGQLEIDVSDMAGETVQVVLNDSLIDQFVAADSYTFPNLAHGDKLQLCAGLVQKSPDLNGDKEVDAEDFAVFSTEWQMNHVDHPSDLNSDGIVDLADLMMLTENWFMGKPRRLYHASMNTDPGWVAEGQWQFGQPLGQGGLAHGNPDPTAGATGQNVFGVNLAGDYALQVGGPHRLTLGPVDCRGYEKVKLNFVRWLNTDEPYYMDCRIEYSVNGTDWNLLWQHEALSFITDDSWMDVDYGLPDAADHRQTLYIRWSYEVLNERVWPFSGWNIDDVEIWARPTEN